MSKSLDVIFYNLGTAPERHKSARGANRQIARELRAMAKTDPDVIALCEAIGHTLPQLKGYSLVRDTSRPGRANIAAYVRHGHHFHSHRWVDLRETWSRTEHPGQHPARSYLVLWVSGVEVIVAHQPPRYTDNTIAAQAEGIHRLAQTMNPHRRAAWYRWTQKRRASECSATRVVFFDANRRPGDSGPGPTSLAGLIGGEVFGSAIDCAVGVNARAARVKYVRKFGRVTLHSDHKHALRVTFLAE